MKHLLTAILFSTLAFGEVSVVEVPIRVETSYAKRVPGTVAFYETFRDSKGRVIAIPEEEIQRFLQLAIDEGFSSLQVDDYGYLPTPSQAVGNTAMAEITINHTDALSFWAQGDLFFIYWDDEHPALVPMVNGVPLESYFAGTGILPPSPQTLTLE